LLLFKHGCPYGCGKINLKKPKEEVMNGGPFGPPGPGPGNPIPPGGIRAGDRTMYPGLDGYLHPRPNDAINENQRIEGDFSRGASGGCNQDSRNIPGGR